MKYALLLSLIFISFSTPIRKPNYYLVHVDAHSIGHLAIWDRVILAYDSIEAKINMIQFIDRVHPENSGEFGGWIIRKINFDKLEYGVVSVRYIP